MAEIHDIKSARSGEAPPRAPAPRRLAAIVAGDIAGYSRLMQVDEEGTHARVKRIERDLIEPSIAEHHGKLVKTTGDGFIAIFDSPVEAVRCGIVIQQNMVGRNASLPKHHWIAYRIGINLGDVIVETNDIYGDGVNIASRLENITDPGQVCISGGIYEQVKHKLVCGYESLGDRRVKNITDPVRVFRVLPDPGAFQAARRRREYALIGLLSLALLIMAGALWYILFQPIGRAGDQASLPALTRPPIQNTTPAAVAVAPKAEAPLIESAAASLPQNEATRPSTIASARPIREATLQAPQPSPNTQPTAVIHEPEMKAISGGTFAMGGNEDPTERPAHQVSIKSFLMSQYPISVREWNDCAAAKACAFVATGKDDAPVTNVSWSDAKQYVTWLAAATRKPYRLPSESEWEYAARAGTKTKYWWGDQFQSGMANCRNCMEIAGEQPIAVGSLKPNPFGLYDMGGGVDQWVEDCWHKNYQGAPADGSAWVDGECASHVIRSGSWKNDARYVRSASRDSYDTNVRYLTHGFRIAASP